MLKLCTVSKNYKDAYRMFKAFNPKKLSQEDNFEAGMSAFSEKDYKMASVNFSYLSPTFIQYDLACYYGGVASFNLGEHEIAKQYFSKAHVLPSKLMEHKMIYLNYIENPPSEQNSKNSKIRSQFQLIQPPLEAMIFFTQLKRN